MHPKLDLTFLISLPLACHVQRSRLHSVLLSDYIQSICFLIHLQKQLLNTAEPIDVHCLRQDLVLIVQHLRREQFTDHS